MTSWRGADLLAALCAAPGIAGHEGQVAEVVSSQLSAHSINYSTDRLGNVVAHLSAANSGAPRVLIFAHMDEVGYMVRKIDADGFLYIERVGGASAQALPGHRLQLWTEAGPLPGVAGVLPQHIANEANAVEHARTYVDIGARSRADAQKMGVEVGCPVTYQPTCVEFNGLVTGKALDDRLGCLLLLQLAEALQADPPSDDVYLAFVVQEETRLRGAMPVAYSLKPDWAIGLDGTLAFDTPDPIDRQTDLRLGGGPAIKVMDHLRGQGQGFIPHLGLRKHIEHVAREHGIALQREVVIGLSTAAAPLPFMMGGLPVAAVSFPLRYSHAPVEVADVADADAALDLLRAVIRQPWRS